MGCGCEVGLPVDNSAGCGLAKGNGGLLNALGCLTVLGLTGDAGRCTLITWGAVAPVVKVVAGLAGMCASLGDARACAGHAVCDGAGCGSLTCLFAVEGHTLVVGSVGSQGTAFADMVQMGSTATSLGMGLMGVGVVELLGTTGLRPRTPSTSAAQSNHAGSYSIASNAGRAVGDGAGSRTSPCTSCSPVFTSCRAGSRSFVPSCFPTPFSSSSPPTAGSSLSCCSTIAMVLSESVAVAAVLAGCVPNRAAAGVGVAMTCRTSIASAQSGVFDTVVVSSAAVVVVVWVGTGVNGVVTWHVSATQSSGSGVVVVS